MGLMDFLKPKTQITKEGDKELNFTPGTGKGSGLIVKRPIKPPEPIANVSERKAKIVTPIAASRG